MDDDLSPVYARAGQQTGIDPLLLLAQTTVESGNNDRAVSPAGAMGRSQFIPSTAAAMGLSDPFDPYESIPAQGRLMRQNFDRHGSPELALAAYHGGDDPKNWGPQTHAYVQKVANLYKELKAQYPDVYGSHEAEPAPEPEAAPKPPPSLRDGIKTAREAGYTDDEILKHLSTSPRIDAARKAGYSDQEIFSHLGLKVAKPAAAPAAEEEPGWLDTAYQGVMSSIRGGQQTYETLTGGKPAPSHPTSKAAEPIEWGDVAKPGLLGRKFLYGLAASAPEIAGFAAGAAVTGGPETPVGLVGGAIGAGLAHAATSLGPEFGRELQATPNDPDGAFHRAAKQTGIGAAFTGIGFGAFGAAPFESTLKNLMFQAFGVQPGVSVAQTAASNVAAGRPAGENVTAGVPGAVFSTAAPMAAHALASHAKATGTAEAKPEPAPEPAKSPEAAALAELEPEPAPVADKAAGKEVPSGGYVMVNPSVIKRDPARFQYKEANEEGLTGALQGVTRWEPGLANPVTLWQDHDGSLTVVNGHQRLGLALKAQENGQDVQMPARIYRAEDGYTPEYMRTLGAYQNIAEGSGTAIDAARVLRATGDFPETMRLPDLPPRSSLVQQANGLARLSDEAFGAVINGVVPPEHAAQVGKAISDPREQMAALDVLTRANPRNVEQARMIVEDIRNSGFLKGAQTTLFGDQEFAQSLIPERARVLDAALRTLRGARGAFKGAIQGEETLTAAGNKLSREANITGKEANDQLIATLQRDATTRGPISDALSDAARDLAAGKPQGAVANRFLAAVRRIEGEGDQPRSHAGGDGLAGEGEAEQPVGDGLFARRLPAPPPTGPDLFGGERKPSEKREPEPRYNTDQRQAEMPGMEPSARQAQAARDQAGPRGGQKAADDGLFAPKSAEQTGLFSLREGRAKLERSLNDTLRSYGFPPEASVRVVDRLTDAAGREADAHYAHGLITLALDAKPEDIPAKLFHEAVHAAFDLGMLTPKDKLALQARADRWLATGDNRARLERLGYGAADLREEAIARMGEDALRRGVAAPTAYMKLVNLVKALGQWLRGEGFRTADDVFGALLRGERRAEGDALLSQRGVGGIPFLRTAIRSGNVKRGADAMTDRLRLEAGLNEARARRSGNSEPTLSRDDVKEIEEFIDFIGHHMFSDVGMRIMRGPSDGALGMYDAARRLVVLFRQAVESGALTRTAVHELWHSLERVLSSDDRFGLAREFNRQQRKWLNDNEWARPFLRNGELSDALYGQVARDWIAKYGKTDDAKNVRIDAKNPQRPVVNLVWNGENYRFKNRSEYFAETMADRYFDDQNIQDAKARSMFAHIRDIWRRMVSGMQQLFGYDATGRIYEGFRQHDYAPKVGDTLTGEDVLYSKNPLPLTGGDGGFDVLRDKTGAERFAAEIKAAFAPTSLRGAKPMEFQIRQHTGASTRALDQAIHALQKVRDATDRLSKDEQVEFTHRMELGQQQPTPELQAVADALRGTLDGWAKKIQGLGKGYLANAIENYMGHIWGNYREWSQGTGTAPTQAEMQTKAIAGNVRRQPLRGSGAFLKQRSFPTQKEGIDAGLIPVTFNPVDLQLIKIHEMQKFYHGTVLADRLKQEKIATWVPQSAERDAEANGYRKLDDAIFQPKLYDVTPIGPVEPGAWYAPEPAARIFNNYMSKGWHGQSAIYDGFRAMNNGLNSLQLGFSGFHASFVMADTTISKLALGLQQVARGEIGRGLGNAVLGTVGAPFAIGKTIARGAELRKAWLDPSTATPEMRTIAAALERAGGRITMPDFFRTGASGSFFKGLADLKNPASAFHQVEQMFRDAPTPFQKAVMTPVRIAGRLIDTINEPLMGALVPRAKAGVFADLASDYLRRNPNATTEDLSAALTKIQDTVDNRLGQLNYDNLFWNKVGKDIAFVAMRSVGWNLGTVRELGGAFVDGAKAIKAVSQGKAPEFTTRMAYGIALPIVTAQIGAIMTYLATGSAPTSNLDYFYPPTGGTTDQGVPERRSIPGYMKDVIAAAHDPVQTVLNKTSPMLSTVTQLAQNKDYYGTLIYNRAHSRGPVQAYADFLLNQVTPFTMRSWGRLNAEGAPALDQMAAFWGFQPAPAAITNPGRIEHFQKLEMDRSFRRAMKMERKGLVTHYFDRASD